MKKIIELAEKICNQNWVIRNEFIEQMRKELAECHQLEQTPITEDWLEEHGWICVTKDFYEEQNGKVAISYSKGPYEEKGWAIACTRIRLNNLADLYDVLELCGIKIDWLWQ